MATASNYNEGLHRGAVLRYIDMWVGLFVPGAAYGFKLAGCNNLEDCGVFGV